MKKLYIFLLLAGIACISTTYAQNNDLFINALRNCTPYNSSGELMLNGVSTTTTKQMQGWNDNKCTYKETVLFNGNSLTITCRFSKSQIRDIVSVADEYYATHKNAAEEVDTSSLEAIQNNPIASVFNKYLQNPEVCTMGGIE